MTSAEHSGGGRRPPPAANPPYRHGQDPRQPRTSQRPWHTSDIPNPVDLGPVAPAEPAPWQVTRTQLVAASLTVEVVCGMLAVFAPLPWILRVVAYAGMLFGFVMVILAAFFPPILPEQPADDPDD
jgi:hypothetical protein